MTNNITAPEAERSLLGSILLDPTCWAEASRIVTRADFADDRHALVWRACEYLHGNRKPIDSMTVMDALRHNGQLERVSGEYVLDLMGCITSSVNTATYAETVAATARKRRLVEAMRQLAVALQRDDDVGQAIDLVRSRLDLRQREPGLPVATLGEAAKSIADIEWLWEGWLPRGMLSMVFAEPNVGKSALCLAFARTVLEGGRWPDGMEQAAGGTVLWVDSEAAQAILIDRARNWGILDNPRFHTLYDADTERFLPLDLSKAGDRNRFHATCKEVMPDLVVLDSLGTIHSGDENSTDMGHILEAAALSAQATQCAMVVIHHSRKLLQEEKDRGPSMSHIRGSSSIQAMVRVAMELMKPDEHSPETVAVTQVKNNLLPYAPSFGFEWLGNELTWCDAPEAPDRDTPTKEAAEWLKGYLAYARRSLSDVKQAAKEAGISQGALYSAKRKLGVTDSRGTNHKMFWVLPTQAEPDLQDDF